VTDIGDKSASAAASPEPSREEQAEIDRLRAEVEREAKRGEGIFRRLLGRPPVGHPEGLPSLRRGPRRPAGLSASQEAGGFRVRGASEAVFAHAGSAISPRGDSGTAPIIERESTRSLPDSPAGLLFGPAVKADRRPIEAWSRTKVSEEWNNGHGT